MKKGVFSKADRNSIFFGILFYAFIVFVISFVSQAPIESVFVGLLPILAYLVVFIIFFMHDNLKNWAIWVFPVIFPLAYLVIWGTKIIPIISATEGPSLFVFNTMLCYFFNAVFFVLHQREKIKIVSNQELVKKFSKDIDKISETFEHEKQNLYENYLEKKKDRENELVSYYESQHQRYMAQINELNEKIAKFQKELKITKNNFFINLRSIEDKCKAINFVIGRIYSNKRGGSEGIRNKLKIDREYYNTFSDIMSDFRDEKASELLNVLEKIYMKLSQLELKEKDVFKLNKYPEIPVEREKDGSSSILEVIAKNDKDPVLEYHAEAKEICIKVIDYLKKEFLRK